MGKSASDLKEEENYVQKIQIYENSIQKQLVIDAINENKQILDKTNDANLRERLYIENRILQIALCIDIISSPFQLLALAIGKLLDKKYSK